MHTLNTWYTSQLLFEVAQGWIQALTKGGGGVSVHTTAKCLDHTHRHSRMAMKVSNLNVLAIVNRFVSIFAVVYYSVN